MPDFVDAESTTMGTVRVHRLTDREWQELRRGEDRPVVLAMGAMAQACRGRVAGKHIRAMVEAGDTGVFDAMERLNHVTAEVTPHAVG